MERVPPVLPASGEGCDDLVLLPRWIPTNPLKPRPTLRGASTLTAEQEAPSPPVQRHHRRRRRHCDPRACCAVLRCAGGTAAWTFCSLLPSLLRSWRSGRSCPSGWVRALDRSCTGGPWARTRQGGPAVFCRKVQSVRQYDMDDTEGAAGNWAVQLQNTWAAQLQDT